MITQISDWVVSEACRQSRAWRDRGRARRRLGQPAAHPLAAVDGGAASLRGLQERPEAQRVHDRDHRVGHHDEPRPLARDPAELSARRLPAWPSTTSAPATRRSRGCARCRCRRSRSTARSSPTCPTIRMRRRSCTRSSSLAANLGLVALAEGIETEEQLQLPDRARLPARPGVPAVTARHGGRDPRPLPPLRARPRAASRPPPRTPARPDRAGTRTSTCSRTRRRCPRRPAAW